MTTDEGPVCVECGAAETPEMDMFGDALCAPCARFVSCDDPNCPAVKDPKTFGDAMAAVEHWRHHSYMSGCSHGN